LVHAYSASPPTRGDCPRLWATWRRSRAFGQVANSPLHRISHYTGRAAKGSVTQCRSYGLAHRRHCLGERGCRGHSQSAGLRPCPWLERRGLVGLSFDSGAGNGPTRNLIAIPPQFDENRGWRREHRCVAWGHCRLEKNMSVTRPLPPEVLRCPSRSTVRIA
jgi:hypothetical protein